MRYELWVYPEIEEIDYQTYESLIKELAVCLSDQSTRDRAAKSSKQSDKSSSVKCITYFDSIEQLCTNGCHTFEKLGCPIQVSSQASPPFTEAYV